MLKDEVVFDQLIFASKAFAKTVTGAYIIPFFIKIGEDVYK